MDRLFLDANVLFSAAYRDGSGLRQLWELGDVQLLISAYAVEEARRNLDREDQHRRLERLLEGVRIVSESASDLPEGVELAEKDVPILQAAIAGKATHLITGDRRDFGRYFGKTVGSLEVMTPRQYLSGRNR